MKLLQGLQEHVGASGARPAVGRTPFGPTQAEEFLPKKQEITTLHYRTRFSVLRLFDGLWKYTMKSRRFRERHLRCHPSNESMTQ